MDGHAEEVSKDVVSQPTSRGDLAGCRVDAHAVALVVASSFAPVSGLAARFQGYRCLSDALLEA